MLKRGMFVDLDVGDDDSMILLKDKGNILNMEVMTFTTSHMWKMKEFETTFRERLKKINMKYLSFYQRWKK